VSIPKGWTRHEVRKPNEKEKAAERDFWDEVYNLAWLGGLQDCEPDSYSESENVWTRYWSCVRRTTFNVVHSDHRKRRALLKISRKEYDSWTRVRLELPRREAAKNYIWKKMPTPSENHLDRVAPSPTLGTVLPVFSPDALYRWEETQSLIREYCLAEANWQRMVFYE